MSFRCQLTLGMCLLRKSNDHFMAIFRFAASKLDAFNTPCLNHSAIHSSPFLSPPLPHFSYVIKRVQTRSSVKAFSLSQFSTHRMGKEVSIMENLTIFSISLQFNLDVEGKRGDKIENGKRNKP